MFMEKLDVDEDVAIILAQEGFSSVDEIGYVRENEMLKIIEGHVTTREDIEN